MASHYVEETQVASSTPFDNTSNGFVATDVQAAIEEAGNHLKYIEVSNTATATSTTTDALITGMLITPAPGTYICWFDCDIVSATAGMAITCSLYVNGVQDPSSVRKIIPFSGGTLTSGNGRGLMALHRTVVVTTGDVEVHWSSSTAGATIAARTFTMLRVL